MYTSGELPRHGEKPLLSRGRQVGLHPAHDRGASSSQTRKSVSCTGNGICKAAQGQVSRFPSRRHTPSLLEPRGRGGRLCSVGRAGPRALGFAGKRGFSPRKTPSPPGSSSDFGGNLCFFQVSDGAQSFVKELLSWKIPRTPSWAKSSVQRDTPPLEDEGSGSSPDGLRPAHLSPYRDAEQEVRGCRHAGARPGPTASPRDAWNSQPWPPSPRSPSPLPCGRTWAVRASSTEWGKR